jgi:hypothetical protein
MTETGNRKVYDQAFKHLAENDPRSLRVMLGALPPDAAAAITRLPKELISSAVIPDELHLIEYRGERRIAHIETRTRSASDALAARVRALPRERIESLVEALFDLADLAAWLDRAE